MTAPAAAESGTALLGTVAGVAAFVATLLFAAQVLLGLYTTSVVTAVTYDAARAVAGADAGASEAARAEAVSAARRQLGRYGERAEFAWLVEDEMLALHVRAPRPALLPRSLVGPIGLGDVERTVRVRIERVR